MRRSSTGYWLAVIAAITAFAVVVVWPDNPDRYLPDFFPWPSGNGLQVGDFDREEMRLGLDLKGGTYVLLEADTARLPPDIDVDAAVEGAKNIIEQRVNAFGVAETEIQREGTNRLSVQLPGISPEEARDLIGKTALLEFREPTLDSQGNVLCLADDGTQFAVLGSTGSAIIPDRESGLARCVDAVSGRGGQAILEPATCKGACENVPAGLPLNGTLLRPDSEVIPQGQGFAVTLEFNSTGGEIFSDVSGRLIDYQVAIFLDGQVITAPVVQQQIGQSSVITGLTLGEAKLLRVQLNSGALPVPMRVVQQTEVDATLGDETVRRTVQGGIVGILAIMAFMVLYYRLPGLLAAGALVVYSSMLLLVLKVGLPVMAPEGFTITLAGIAAFVLSVGLAVDANVLVFERLKEELRAGRSLPTAIEAGFDRAWPSIRDSNAASIISGVILWWFGEQFDAALVIGFAKVLLVGVILSMFSAIVVTRTFLRLIVGTPLARSLWLFGAETSRARDVQGRPFVLDFVGRRGFYYLLSILILVPGAISLLVPPALKPGIEFSSGTTFTVQFVDRSVEAEDIRSRLGELNQPQVRVQKTSEGEFILRMGELEGAVNLPPVGPAPPSEREEIENGLRSEFGALNVTNFSTVSEIASRSIARNSAIAVGAAALVILLYISYSFRHVPNAHRYGIAAVVAAMHDALFLLGAFSIFGKVFDIEINTMFITGVLTVIGFSVHDTIVVFDRIRENVGRSPGVPFDEVVNASLTETVGRSVNTSMTLVFTIMALLLIGGPAIQSFLLALLIGIIAGGYSSIFVASQILVSWEDADLSRLWRRVTARRELAVEAEA